MVRFSSNIVVVSIIIVNFTLNYASAEVTDPPNGMNKKEYGIAGGFVATGAHKTEKYENGKKYLVADNAVYGDAGFRVGRGNAIIPMEKNMEPEPKKIVLSKKKFTGKCSFGVGSETTVENVKGKRVINKTFEGYIDGRLSIARTLNDCEAELMDHFGENCIQKNKAKLCANRAMVALTLSDLPDGVAKMYFMMLMKNIRENSAMNTEEFCVDRFKNLEKDLNYVISLIKKSDLPKSSSYETELYNGVIKKEIDKCIENLQLFREVDFYDPGYKTKCILKNAFKNIKLIKLKNTDEIDYFIDNIFKRYHIEADVQNPKKFCLIHQDYQHSKVPVELISD